MNAILMKKKNKQIEEKTQFYWIIAIILVIFKHYCDGDINPAGQIRYGICYFIHR